MFTELLRDHRKRSGHRVAAKGDRLIPGSSTEAFAQSMPKHTYVQEYGKAGLFAPLTTLSSGQVYNAIACGVL